MKKTSLMLLFLVGIFWAFDSQAQAKFEVGRFPVNGPAEVQYLGQAAQDAIVGTLRQRGYESTASKNVLDPDSAIPKSPNAQLFKIAGRINAVGNTYRIRLKVAHADQSQDEYLQISDLNQLIPSLESYVDQKIIHGIASGATPAPAAPVAKNQAPLTSPAVSTPAPNVNVSAPPPANFPEKNAKNSASSSAPKSTTKRPVEKETISKKDEDKNLRGYNSISPRLPFEVRSLAYGDLNGDGNPEIILTSQQKLYIYQWQGNELKSLADFTGKKSDYFVKVDILPVSGVNYIVLTNLRSEEAASKILKFEQNKLVAVAEEIPYQLRVLESHQLVGSPYSAKASIKPQVMKLSFDGQKVEPQGKMDLPFQTQIYGFADLPQQALVTMTPLGKLQYYRQENGKFEKSWSSRETYGGTGNYVPTEVTDAFNEVVADFFPIPARLGSLSDSRADVVVVRNQSVTRDIVGRVPLISDGQLIRLKWDEMGFVETWVSKKVDGSIQDFLVIRDAGKPQILAAVRLKNPGFMGDVIDKGDSVLIKYDVED